MASPRTIDDEFNNQQYSREGVSLVGQQTGAVRNVKTTHKISEADKRIQAERAKMLAQATAVNDDRFQQTTDEKFDAGYDSKGLTRNNVVQFRKKREYEEAQIEQENQEINRQVVVGQQAKRKKTSLAKKKRNLAKVLKNKVQVTRINMMIWTIGTYLWLLFQVPMAILSLVSFGAAVAFYSVTEVLKLEPKPDDGFFTSLAKDIGSLAIKGLEIVGGAINGAIKYIAGFDLSVLHPENLFMVSYVTIIAFSLLQLILFYLLWKMAMLNPLSGDGAGMKIGALILAVVGYSFPLLNLFPWFMFWVIAVWLKPK